MSITYAQKNKNVVQTKQKSFASIIDSSSQSESLQRKADMANNAAQRAEAPRPNNTGMPDNLKSGIESLSGFSMDDVRVHYNSSKPATVQALAYTQGTDIHVAPGQEKHLPHEAWHVAQQMAGRVSPTTNINGMPVNDNAALEHEADVMGEIAIGQRKEKKIENKTCISFISQLKPDSNIDLICSANINYTDKNDKEQHVKGVGFNDASTASTVLKKFKEFGLIRLAEGKYAKEGHNPAGQCAEPHAVADALSKKNKDDVKEINSIYVSNAVVRKYIGKSLPNEKEKGKNYTYPPCDTCKQWIDENGMVKEYYLQKKVEETDYDESPSSSNIETSYLYKPSRPSEWDETTKSPKNVELYYNNVSFLNADKLMKGKQFPQDFIDDKNTQTIDEQSGLRTIIKAQMLKNSAYEIKTDLYKQNRENCKKGLAGSKKEFEKKCGEEKNTLKNIIASIEEGTYLHRELKKIEDNRINKRADGVALYNFIFLYQNYTFKLDALKKSVTQEVLMPIFKKQVDSLKKFGLNIEITEKKRFKYENVEYDFGRLMSFLLNTDNLTKIANLQSETMRSAYLRLVESSQLSKKINNVQGMMDKLKNQYQELNIIQQSMIENETKYENSEKELERNVNKDGEYNLICNRIDCIREYVKEERKKREKNRRNKLDRKKKKILL